MGTVIGYRVLFFQFFRLKTIDFYLKCVQFIASVCSQLTFSAVSVEALALLWKLRILMESHSRTRLMLPPGGHMTLSQCT